MTPKTFYFGMNEDSIAESRNHQDQDPGGKAIVESEAKLPNRDRGDGRASFIADAIDDTDDNERSVVENISLKLRPTLPKKQLEIPRFSPSAAWRLLSTLETPGPSMSTASEEVPVMFEERIERLSRPPPPFPLSLGPRSWHDKSGDSGISGDAGAGNEDSFEVSTINRIKTTVTRPTWTPQQDLGEESSSDAGVDSPPPLSTPLKYHSPRAHVFSLSLPRDETRTTCLCAPETKTREASAFNSLQKLKRSVSGAFGIGSHEHQRKCTRDVLDDNWLLSTSAPTSLQHSRVRIEATRISPSAWRPFLHRDRDTRHVQRPRDSDDDDDDDNDNDDDDGDDERDHDVDHNIVDDDLPEDEDERIKRDTKIEENDFPVIMKPPSFSYLTPGGHVMYLPEMNETKHRARENLRDKKAGTNYTGITSCERNIAEQSGSLVEITPFQSRTSKNAKRNSNDDDNGNEERTEQVNDREEDEEEDEEEREEEAEEDDNEHEDEEENKISNVSKRRCKSSKNRVNDSRESFNQFSACAESRENVSQPKQRRMFSPTSNDERGTANPWNSKHPSSFDATEEVKPQRKNNSKSRRFTFQSTVRQIERRRLAEKLSREVEAKERQRKGELEAMRKVEEEFQRKRAKEKANIRQQLRLFKEMEENFNSLPTTDWDGSQLSRADPDGAPSSTASSPTSLPIGNSSTITLSKRDSDSTKQPRAEQKGYRPKYYDWSPDTSNHLDNHRQTTVHPKVVCDIPKSSPVFVDANVHPSKPPITSNSTPKSDNYRKDFAHGTVATKTSFASSDSELSQPNTRPHSRQNGIKSKPLRPRSGSPVRSVGAATSEEDLSLPVEPTKRPRNPTHDFILSGVQPFTKQKAYRPISFNPHSPSPILS
ncbi:hypothetical protein K0M31_018235 [Melipona bicolor]|uniref:Uncharacterized protein n=1 Tax=Melipona bicolor TaxID=60889 RepID=A0AA40KDX8_9HYME|nr:hypothetical protein K0M31_018235 [Melipona bicolor]